MNDKTHETPRLSLKWLYLAWFGFAFASFIFTVLGAIAQGDPRDLILRLGLVTDVAVFAIAVWNLGMVIAVMILFLHLRHSDLGRKAVGFRGCLSIKAVLFAGLGWLLVTLMFYGVERIIGLFEVTMFWRGGSESRLIDIGSATDWTVLLIGPVIISPITEEIVYRGYVLTALCDRLGALRGILLSALIFASVHVMFGPGMMVYTFLGSFVFAYLYLRFNSIYPGMLMHFLINLWAYIIVPPLFM
jgi:membrane protease YdiL (CAAX protease family)